MQHPGVRARTSAVSRPKPGKDRAAKSTTRTRGVPGKVYAVRIRSGARLNPAISKTAALGFGLDAKTDGRSSQRKSRVAMFRFRTAGHLGQPGVG